MAAIKQSNAIFLSISDGKIVRRFINPTADSITRVTKEGKTVHEEHYKGWSGRIVDIQFKEHQEYGVFVNVHIYDNGESAILQMKQSSGYANAFMKMLPNVDFESDVVISPTMKIEGDKKKVGLFITQHGQPIKWAFTRENPNGIPELKKIKVKGKEVYDDSEIIEFFENMVKETILPKLKGSIQQPVADGVADDNSEEAPF